jgi:hypothetical protein
MNTVTQPIFWVPALAIFIALLAFLAFLGSLRSRGLARGALMLIALIFTLLPGYLFAAVFAPNLIDSRIRTYWAFYHAIEIGMTRQEVVGVMDLHYPAEGQRQRPTIMNDSEDRLGFFMNPEQYREPNHEGIFLDFADGKVTRKSYSAD